MARTVWLAPLLALALLAGCGRDTGKSQETSTAPLAGRTVHVVDANGTEVKIALPVRRLVSLSSDNAEVIRAIGAADRLVGVSSSVAGHPEFWGPLSRLPNIGRSFAPNCELIVELRPDLVIAGGMRPDSTFDEKMANLSIPVVTLDCYKPERMVADARALGGILEREEAAEELVRFIEKWTRVVEQRLGSVAAERRPRVYVEGYRDFQGSGLGTGGHSMCLLAGGRNIVESLRTPTPKVSSEWVIEQNPDVILKPLSVSSRVGGYGARNTDGMKKARDEIASRTGWDRIAAVQKAKVCLVSSDVWLGPSHVAALLQMAKWFHPDLFADIEPREVLVEYLSTFHGLTNPGVPFYP